MKEKHPIDSFFKEKLADRQIPFKEEYWSSASALIEAHTNRKRRRFLWIFLFLGLLIGSSLVTLYTFQAEGSWDPAQLSETALIPHVKEGKKDKKQISSQGAVHALMPKQDQGSMLIVQEEEKPQVGKGMSKEEGTTSSLPGSQDPDLITQKYTRTQKAATTQSNNNLLITPQEEQETPANTQSRVLDHLESENPELSTKISETEITTPLVLGTKQIAVQAEQVEILPFLLKQEQPTSPSNTFPIWGNQRKHRLGIDAGFALNRGISNREGTRASMGMSPLVGISYQYQLARSLALRSGIRYVQHPALAGDSTYLSTNFNFGAQIQGTTITPLALHQVEIPLSLRWQLGTRSSITAGTYLRYLINVSSDVSQFESNPFESRPGPTRKEWGYKQGFQKLDMGLQMGYYYHLSEGLQVGMEVQYGLRDVRDNTFYREQSFDRNLNARLVLSYDFLRF